MEIDVPLRKERFYAAFPFVAAPDSFRDLLA